MKNKAMKSRLAFIAGQLYETLGKTSRARESYQICLSGQPDSYDMLLEANLRKALNANSKRQDLYKELELGTFDLSFYCYFILKQGQRKQQRN